MRKLKHEYGRAYTQIWDNFHINMLTQRRGLISSVRERSLETGFSYKAHFNKHT